MSRTHGGIGRGDDGHKMESITVIDLDKVSACWHPNHWHESMVHTYLWIPDFHLQDPILDRLQQDRLRPGPFVDDSKELPDNH